jgi:hypothetical protein
VADRPLGQAQEHGQAVAGGGGQRVAVGRQGRRPAVQAVAGREQLELVEQGDAGATLDLLAGDVPGADGELEPAGEPELGVSSWW